MYSFYCRKLDISNGRERNLLILTPILINIHRPKPDRRCSYYIYRGNFVGGAKSTSQQTASHFNAPFSKGFVKEVISSMGFVNRHFSLDLKSVLNLHFKFVNIIKFDCYAILVCILWNFLYQYVFINTRLESPFQN